MFQMHMVHVSSKYDSCFEAVHEDRGIAVLAVLFEVRAIWQFDFF